jgi:hypothetical protein
MTGHLKPTPEPMVPIEVDLREFAYMPLDVVRLRDSDLSALSTGEEFRAAVLLWCAAWHQIPAGSLPTDNRMLANLAGFGRDVRAWSEVRAMALKGFVECTDGRFYHPVIADKAIEAWSKRKRQRERTENATAARQRQQAERDAQRNDERNGQRDDAQPDDVTFTNRREGKGEEGKKNPPSPPKGDVAVFFDHFWTAYPKRGGANPRKPAFDKFAVHFTRGVDPEAIIAGAEAYAHQCEALGKIGTEKVAQAVTWLNQERWADDHGIPDAQAPPCSGGGLTAWQRQAQAFEDLRNERDQQRPDKSLAGPILSLPRTGTDGQ